MWRGKRWVELSGFQVGSLSKRRRKISGEKEEDTGFLFKGLQISFQATLSASLHSASFDEATQL